MALIQIKDLSKTYVVGDQKVHALRKISLDIKSGEFVTIVGPSGSGKSTFMHILGCLDKPNTGSYVLNGRDVSELTKDELARVRNTTIGFVFQSFNLLSRTSAIENVELPLLYNGNRYTPAERKRKAVAALAAVGLAERGHHHPNQLSGGQQQRVAIARALMSEPPILLADEPTGNLDTRTSIEVLEIFQQLQRDRGITVIVITHEHQIAEYGTRIITFRDGRIVSDTPNGFSRLAAEELEQLPAPASEVA
jgi:putative ABC transport system ATP-binding protein